MTPEKGTKMRLIALAALTVFASALTPSLGASPQTTFTSERYGYSLELSTQWSVLEMPGTWDGALGDGIPGTDHLANLSLQIRGLVAARSAGTMSLRAWRRKLDRALPGGCLPKGKVTRSTIAGSPALMRRFRCYDGYSGRQFALLHKGRAFAIGSVWPTGKGEKRSGAAFAQLLTTFQFTS
jgi:hypothetical protein